MRWSRFFVFALISLGSIHITATTAQSKSAYLAGPVFGYLERVIDGDTIRARAQIWLNQEVRITIRLNGVDTPELHGRCAYESTLARKARQFTADWLSSGPIQLTRIKQGKYGGRVVAAVANAQGGDLGRALLNEGLARPYGGAKRKSWCRLVKQPQSSQ